MKKKIFIILSIIIVLLLAVFIYLNIHYKSENVDKYLKSNDVVKVTKIKNGYYFDGEGEGNAIIFYPGAKVEYISYAPLMYQIASSGVDCFLVKMPFNIAFFKPNIASKIIDKYDYDNWYLSGHSLGGVVASSYALKNEDKIKGIIFLASYSTKPLSDNLKVLSIYGAQDGVLNKKSYEKSKKTWNDSYTEYIIEGGNHANFGNYGNQKGDKKASISQEEQQAITTEKIISFIKE